MGRGKLSFLFPRQSQRDKEGREELLPDINELIALKESSSRLLLTPDKSMKSTIPGDHHSPFRGQGLEFDAVREYVAGDDVRNIDWRVTARSGSPHLKLFKEERERQVILCVDMNSAMRFGTKKSFKSLQAARVAAFLGWQSLAAHDRVGACLFGDVAGGILYHAPRRTRSSFWAMCKELSSPPREQHEVELSDALMHIARAEKTGALIYVISDFMAISDDLEKALLRLNRHSDIVCIAVNDAADSDIPPVGLLQLQGAAGNKFLVDTADRKGRERYQEMWRQNRSRLEQILKRTKVAMVQLTTEMELPRHLILGLKMVAGRRRR